MPETVAIADIAAHSDVVESGTPSAAPVWLTRNGRPLRAAERNKLLHWRTMPHVEIRSWLVRNVVLDATTMLLLRDGRIVRESNYHRPAQELLSIRVDPARLTRIETDLPVLVCGDAWSTNHYHFLNHTLPAIADALARHGANGVWLAAHAMRPVHADIVAMLGLAGARQIRLEPGRQYEIACAVFCDYTVGRADFSNSRNIQDLHDRIGACVQGDGEHQSRVYVSRQKDRHRHAVGEADLITGLARRGFIIATPAEMTIAEQIALFRGARLVVGPHGAGLANISFCRPGTAVYQFLPQHFIEPSVVNLAIRRGARIWVDVFPGDGDGADHVRNWRLDARAILRRVDEIEGATWWSRLPRIAQRGSRRLGSLARPRRLAD